MFKILLIGVIAMIPLSGIAAMCATVDAQNAVIVNTTPIGECAGLVVMNINDWPGASVWAMPTTDEMMLVWMAGFTVPMTLFLISWAIGMVVNFFRR